MSTCPAPVLVRCGLFLRATLLQNLRGVKNERTKGGCSTGKKTKSAVVFYRGFDVFSLFPVVSYDMEFSNFIIGTLRVLLNQMLNFTTSDTRQDGQSSPFTTISSQRVRGMRNCRASIVAETEKPFLMEHQRLYPLLFAF